MIFTGMVIFPISAKAQSQDEVYRQLLLELLESLQQQLALLLQEQAMVVEGMTSGGEFEYRLVDAEQVLFEYKITSPSAVSRIADEDHRAYFSEVFDIFPTEYGQMVTQVMIFDASEIAYDAFVETIAPEHETWTYAVSEDVLNEVGEVSNFELVVHELAHIISYQPVAGLARPAQISCHEYFKRQGCLSGNMYLDEFVDEFWSSTDLNRAIQFQRVGDTSEEVIAHYDAHADEYVSDYAAFNPEEDFAESFMHFVMDYETLPGSEAEAKINFFDSFNEIRTIKADIKE